MQFSQIVITITVLLSVCIESYSHRVEPKWLYIEPTAEKEAITEAEEINNHDIRKFNEAHINTDNLNAKETPFRNKYYENRLKDEVLRKNLGYNNPHILDIFETLKRNNEFHEINSNKQEIQTRFEPTHDTENYSDSNEIKNDMSKGKSLNYLQRFSADESLPTLILKISLLRKAAESKSNTRLDKRFTFEKDHFRDNVFSEEFDGNDVKEAVPEYPIIESIVSPPLWRVDPEMKTIYITRGRLPSSQSSLNYEYDKRIEEQRNLKLKPDTEHQVSKRIFSFLSRVQGMHSAKDMMEHRRHFHSYGVYPTFDSNGDIVSAETRAFIRPPGSPLRWG